MLKQLLNFTFPYTIWTDGAARGNRNGNGPSSCGFVVKDNREGNRIYAAAWALGPHTNNHAEYTAIIYALNWVLAQIEPVRQYIHFKSDSEFMVRQLNGVYQVRNPKMKPLYDAAMGHLVKLPGYKIEHVRREFNTEADEMCNKVLDLEKKSGVTFVEEQYTSRSRDTSGREDCVGGASNDGPAEGAGTEGASSAHSAGHSRLGVRGRTALDGERERFVVADAAAKERFAANRIGPALRQM